MRLAFSRGHIIYATNIHAWKYADTDELYDPNNERPCIRCGRRATAEGHDACLGTIPGVTNACCGHGVQDPYIQYPNGFMMDMKGMYSHKNLVRALEMEIKDNFYSEPELMRVGKVITILNNPAPNEKIKCVVNFPIAHSVPLKSLDNPINPQNSRVVSIEKSVAASVIRDFHDRLAAMGNIEIPEFHIPSLAEALQMKRACKRAASWIDGTAEFWTTDNIHGCLYYTMDGNLNPSPLVNLSTDALDVRVIFECSTQHELFLISKLLEREGEE